MTHYACAFLSFFFLENARICFLALYVVFALLMSAILTICFTHDVVGRAKYIIGTVKALQSKPGGGVEWLVSLRNLDLQEVIDALSTLPGVGPKVAACIALFSLDQHHAIPVDTHVWQVCS